MTRDSFPARLLVIGCLAALLLACFHRVFFDGHQFAYRDAAHYYYPLYELVQREWSEGRWPLWEPEENAGMPLMGNPTAAVLYPGKIVYAALPYAWAARVYIVGHVVLAFAAMVALMRSWKVSWVGAGLSGLSYAFSGPILFQYCNVIYLVGAAWLPLGFLAVDRWVRSGSRRALLGLSLVLTMQTLGGDPQAAYLLGLCALGYAAAASWSSGLGFRESASATGGSAAPRGGRRKYVLAAGLAAAWILVTLELARILPGFRPPKLPDKPTKPLSWMLWVPTVVPVVWAIVLAIYFARRKPKTGRRTLWTLALGLGGAGTLAGALASAQLLPVIEFTQQTTRAAAGGPHEIYPFSVEPFRLVEMLWPNVFGSYFQGNASWLDLVRISDDRSKVWVPSLYLGGVIVVLALAAASFRRGEAARVWLSWVVLATLIGSFGEFSSPIWASRLAESTIGVGYPGIGPFDPPNEPPLRKDGRLRDGDGGVYWAMTTFLPGFRQFRFPSKLMTFSVLGLAALAGFGWDDLARDDRARRSRRTAATLLGLSAIGLVGWQAGRTPILKAFEASTELATAFGPFQADAAFRETRFALLQGGLVFAAFLGVLALRRRRPGLACVAALALVTIDLAAANRRMIATAPQELFEVEPEVLGVIKAAEAVKPAEGPYRVHRSPIWNPPGWSSTGSHDRVRDFMEWERATIQPKYGITLGVEYTHTIGVAELYDYEWYFGGWLFSTSPEFARSIGITPGQKVVYFPRRSFDMWNTRYFILPSYTSDWLDENRGFASFLADTEVVHPKPPDAQTEAGKKAFEEWVRTKDYQVRRNLNTLPRAWVVHRARPVPTLRGMSPEARSGPMMEIMYDDRDPIWRDPTMISHDPRQQAWVESDDAPALAAFASGGVARPSEKVDLRYPRPDRVELSVTLDAPGIVVLSDVYYPGWKLTVDGEPAPIYRVNRMMRGAAVASGTHQLVYTYEPTSFRVGLLASAAGLTALLGLSILAVKRPSVSLPWSMNSPPGA